MKKLILLGLVLSTMLFAGTAMATKGVVGLGVGTTPDYEGSDDNTGVPMFMFNHMYDSGRFVKVMGGNMKVNLLTNKQFSLGPVLNYRLGRDDSLDVDNKRVSNMRTIDNALEAGVFAGMDIDNFLLGLEVLADISDEHDGWLVQVHTGYRFQAMPDLTITPTAFVTGADSDYMDTYFGVNAGNRGSSGLPDYSADSGIKDVGINVVVNYTPWEQWGVMGLFSYKTLLNDAKDSPVVDDEGNDKQLTLGVMATYRWGK